MSITEQVHHFIKDANPTTSTQHKRRFNRPTTNGHRPDAQRTGCTRAKERATKDKAKERHNGTTKEKDTEDTTTVDMAKAKHKHQLVTAMRSQDQDRNYGSTSE